MEVPNWNRQFLEEVKEERENAELSKLSDMGNCNLQSLHGAFKSGCEKTGWELKSKTKGAFQLLKDSLARCEGYVSMIGSTLFLSQFCISRYVKFHIISFLPKCIRQIA